MLQFLGHKRTKQKQFVWHKSMGLNRWIERPQIQFSFWIKPNYLDICDTWAIGVIQQSLFFCSIKWFLLWHQNVTRAFVISRNGENSNKVSIQKIINLQFINPWQRYFHNPIRNIVYLPLILGIAVMYIYNQDKPRHLLSLLLSDHPFGYQLNLSAFEDQILSPVTWCHQLKCNQ